MNWIGADGPVVYIGLFVVIVICAAVILKGAKLSIAPKILWFVVVAALSGFGLYELWKDQSTYYSEKLENLNPDVAALDSNTELNWLAEAESLLVWSVRHDATCRKVAARANEICTLEQSQTSDGALSAVDKEYKAIMQNQCTAHLDRLTGSCRVHLGIEDQ